MWEEPPISGWKGSGTVFFSGCPLHCVYCQNQEISDGTIGKEVSLERLAEIFLEQQGRGAHNINLVTPTQFAPQIVEALDLAKAAGLKLPIVYNTSGYESLEGLKIINEHVDIFLVDYKYGTARVAQKYSKAADYPEVASAALDEMYRQVGPYTEDPETGLLKSGVIVRHLLLPDGLFDSFAVMRTLANKPYIQDVWISLMSQYTEMPHVREKFPELAKPIDPDDYEALIDYALSLGLENSFCQEGSAASESFIPAFDYEGV